MAPMLLLKLAHVSSRLLIMMIRSYGMWSNSFCKVDVAKHGESLQISMYGKPT